MDPLLPFRQIELAVNRTADEVYEGYPRPLWRQEGLGLRGSLAMHTRNGAFQLHQEKLTAQIRRGFAADLIVLDRGRPSGAAEARVQDQGRPAHGRWKDRPPGNLNE